MKNTVLSESSFDYKYRSIFSHIKNVEVKEGGFIYLMKILLSKKSYYHIRYIKYRGPILTFVRLFIVYLFSKISKSKIIWSCHNIYEHNIESKRINNLVRLLLSKWSYKIVVFHRDLINHLPPKHKNKIIVACFGDYRSFINNQTKANPHFKKFYQKWLNINSIEFPELISISAARNNNLDFFINKINNDYKFLVIAPKVSFEKIKPSENILIYNHSFVQKEVTTILSEAKKLIGIIGHNNISVPTSIYMYASFQIPIIVLDINPLNSIVNDYGIGEVIKEEQSLKCIIDKIKSNYIQYQENCDTFIQDNSWEKSASIHQKIFK